MRYFFISYLSYKNNQMGFGNLSFSCNAFPPLELLRKKRNDKTIQILSIFEFKNKKDYMSFNKGI